MSDHQVKHLEMIQSVVSRMARCSFAYKGWAITIVAGIFALAFKTDNYLYLLAALMPTVAFWWLDAYYLRQERLFRGLYDAVRKMSPAEWSQDPFSMNTVRCAARVDSLCGVALSGTIAWLYLPLTAVVLAAAVALRWYGEVGC